MRARCESVINEGPVDPTPVVEDYFSLEPTWHHYEEASGHVRASVCGLDARLGTTLSPWGPPSAPASPASLTAYRMGPGGRGKTGPMNGLSGAPVLLLSHSEECLLELTPPPPHFCLQGIEPAAARGQGGEGGIWPSACGWHWNCGFFPKPPAATSLPGSAVSPTGSAWSTGDAVGLSGWPCSRRAQARGPWIRRGCLLLPLTPPPAACWLLCADRGAQLPAGVKWHVPMEFSTFVLCNIKKMYPCPRIDFDLGTFLNTFN